MKLTTFLILSISFTAVVGDYMVFNSKYSESFIYRAILDNFIHAAIGTLSALLFFLRVDVTRQAWIYNVALCTFVSSFIDIDHFIVAKSLYFKDLTNLRQRGFLHCTSLWMIFTVLLLLYSYLFKKTNVYILAYMVTIAYTSHHIRDGHRRGLWFYPLGHTPPIHKYMYVTILCILPLLFSYTYQYIKPLSKNTVIQYSMLV